MKRYGFSIGHLLLLFWSIHPVFAQSVFWEKTDEL